MFKSLLFGIFALAIVSASSITRAQDYDLEPAFTIKDGGTDIKLRKSAMPYFVDWNNDGKKDLLASWYDHAGGYLGRLFIWINQGTNDAPEFNGYSQVDNVTEFDGF